MRVIPDVPKTIIDTVNEVRAKFDYVFTTGGIGPTHDDITSECVAAAFGVPWEPHPEAWARMERSYKPGEFNAARQRMATMPRGATLIDNAMSGVDGVPYRALLALDVPAWEPAACPLCARGEPVVAPGSRHLAAKA